MKKILNKDVTCVVDEMLMGFVAAYKNYYKKIDGYNAILYKEHRKNKVALVIGGGTGHEPLFGGFCGAGLADGVACGNICASPNPELICAIGREVNQGKGVLFLYGCYAGDNMNFDMAEEMLQKEGIQTAHVRVCDDFASAPEERKTDRRGIAGDVFVLKVAGAACDAGFDLDEVVRITKKAEEHVRTIGVATRPGTLPGNDKPTFELADDEMEYGMGIHGEPGIERTKMKSAEEIVARMYEAIREEMKLHEGDELVVLINGLGSTPLLELNIVFYDLYKLLKRDGIKVYDAEIKTYCTCMEMGGFSITFMRLDEELKKYYDMPCYSPYYAKGSVAFTVTNADDVCFEEVAGADAIEIMRKPIGVLDELDAEDVRNMLLYVADQIIKNKEYLTEIDSAIGDGDHGLGMAGGMRKAAQVLKKRSGEQNVFKLFEEAGNAMLMSMGGASGVIFGSLYLAGAKDQKGAPVLKASDIIAMEKKSLLAIQERGKAQLGDKTMVDALVPAIEAMEKTGGHTLLETLAAAEKGAELGVENTKKYVAKFGRAKSLLERAIGHQDAGATSVYLIFRSMREYVEGTLRN